MAVIWQLLSTTWIITNVNEFITNPTIVKPKALFKNPKNPILFWITQKTHDNALKAYGSPGPSYSFINELEYYEDGEKIVDKYNLNNIRCVKD